MSAMDAVEQRMRRTRAAMEVAAPPWLPLLLLRFLLPGLAAMVAGWGAGVWDGVEGFEGAE